MIVYGLHHRVPVHLVDAGVIVWVSPLTYLQKQALNELVQRKAGEEVVDGYRLAFLSVKFGVKGVEGLTLPEGGEYQLEFDPDGSALTDDCANELMQMGESQKMIKAVSRLCNEIREYEIDGVLIDLKSVKSAKKKA